MRPEQRVMEKKSLKFWAIERLLSFRSDTFLGVRLAPVMLHYTPGGTGVLDIKPT